MDDGLWNEIAKVEKHLTDVAIATSRGLNALAKVKSHLREKESIDGGLSGVQRADHMGDRPDRGEDPAGRSRATGSGERSLPDSDRLGAAEGGTDPGGEPAADFRGSPANLPAAARHLTGATEVRITEGAHAGEVGTLRQVNEVAFGRAYARIAIPTYAELVIARVCDVEPA